MIRQGLNISLKELIDLKLELIKEQLELNKSLGIDWIDYDRRVLINIINKEGLSDTWEIDK